MAGNEEVQAKRDLLSGIESYGQANKELESLKSELRGKEVACYISGGDSCIKKYDNFRIRYAMMNREHERDLEDCLDVCRSMLPKSLVMQDLSKLHLGNREELVGFRDFVKCHVGCLSKGKEKIESMKTDVKTVLQQVALHS